MESALLSSLEENLRQLERFWEVWPSKRRFGQNLLRMTWKERSVQFLWKAHRFSVLERTSGQCDDFDNFDAQKCDLAKTCSAWPEKSVLYNFHEKRTVFSFWREFEASVTILTTLALKNAIRSKRVAHDLKKAFFTILKKAHCFRYLERIGGQHDDFDNFDAHKYDLAKTCSAWPGKSVLYNFHKKRTVYQVWREFETRLTILRNLMLKNAISPKRAAHDLKRTFCAILMKSALFSLFGENWGQCDDFDNFDAHKCDLAKTCCAWPEKSVLYNFHGKRTVFPFWREFEASVTILTTWTLTNAIWPNVLRITWKERFVKFLWKAHCFPV